MNDLAFVAIVNDQGCSLGIAQEFRPGYSPQSNPFSYPFDLLRAAKVEFNEETGGFKSYEVAKKAADLLNEQLFKLTKERALQIVLSSMANGTER